jgi:dihydroxyacetone kinase-like predicted kinase
MKSLKIFAAALAAFALLSITNVDAQSKKEGWQDKMKSEKIGFITVELNLTPEEAQVFWPVYNEIANRKAELQKQVRESYKALLKALAEKVRDDGKEYITIYYGADVKEKHAQKAADIFAEICPDADVNLLHGGQPVYYYLISAE